MATDKNKKRRNPITAIIIIIVMVVAAYFGIDVSQIIQWDETTPPGVEETTNNTGNNTGPVISDKDSLVVTMLDVGQGDCFLLETADKTMLIDCGTESTQEEVIEYLKKEGITRLDEFYGTHYHDDHIGAMYHLITNIEIGTIYLPEMANGLQTADWYLGLKQELKTGNYNVKYVSVGTEYKFGNANVKVIGPISDPGDELNNYSTILLVSFGEMDILFTGDAEKTVEKDLIASGENLDIEILKLGHHGSSTSTSAAFLDATTPDYALISCGLGNRFKHPTEEVMDRLQKRDIEIYRTDESGTVILTITKNSVSFNSQPGDYLSGTELREKEGKE